MAACVEGKFLPSFLYFMMCSLTIFGSSVGADNKCPASQ